MFYGFGSFVQNINGRIISQIPLSRVSAHTSGAPYLRFGPFSVRIKFGQWVMALVFDIGGILGYRGLAL